MSSDAYEEILGFKREYDLGMINKDEYINGIDRAVRYGVDPVDVVTENNRLKEEVEELEDVLRNIRDTADDYC